MAVSFNITIPGESAVAVTLSTDAVTSITAYINANQTVGGGTTLAAPVAAGDLTMTLTSVAGLTTGMGLLIGTEISLVTAIAGVVTTVTRARIGTTAAAYLINAPVTFVRTGSYGEYVASLIRDAVVVAMTSFPGAAITAANQTIATAQAAIQTAIAGGVTHAP